MPDRHVLRGLVISLKARTEWKGLGQRQGKINRLECGPTHRGSELSWRHPPPPRPGWQCGGKSGLTPGGRSTPQGRRTLRQKHPIKGTEPSPYPTGHATSQPRCPVSQATAGQRRGWGSRAPPPTPEHLSNVGSFGQKTGKPQGPQATGLRGEGRGPSPPPPFLLRVHHPS